VHRATRTGVWPAGRADALPPAGQTLRLCSQRGSGSGSVTDAKPDRVDGRLHELRGERLGRRPTQRNNWQGLTTAQVLELDEACSLPHRRGMTSAEAWEDVAREFAMRAASLLVNNDL